MIYLFFFFSSLWVSTKLVIHNCQLYINQCHMVSCPTSWKEWYHHWIHNICDYKCLICQWYCSQSNFSIYTLLYVHWLGRICSLHVQYISLDGRRWSMDQWVKLLLVSLIKQVRSLWIIISGDGIIIKNVLLNDFVQEKAKKLMFFLYYYIIIFLSFVAPASPPLDFIVTNIAPNTISLSWSPPFEQDMNGIIDNYTIRYYITEQLGVVSVNETVNVMIVSSTKAALTGLGNYTVYNISVSAVIVGEGSSTSLSQRTAQNGMMLHSSSLSAILVTSFCIAHFLWMITTYMYILPLNCTALCT